MTKNMSRPVRYGLLAVVLTASLAACDAQETSSPATEAEDTTSSGSPELEGTGPEPPRPETDDQSVLYPNLPAGEDDYDSSEVRQCLTVAWLGSVDVPDGVSVQVKSVRITPSGVVELAGSSCDGVQGCTESFAFTSADESCSVPLDATASNGTKAYLRLTGRCVSQDARQCDELLADDGSPISLYQPEPPTDEEDQPSEEEQQPSEEEQPPPSEESPPTG